ncbi:MAG TPA: aminoglycoside phosphotransferase family protein [Dongiaceae bacterium]|nr:aminoglycoside phosphotransferase family protein [Dongiaceae bacterium]
MGIDSVEPGSPYERAAAAARRMSAWPDTEIALHPAAATIAVPMFCAVENDCWRVGSEGASAFLKVPSPDMVPFLDPAAAHGAIAVASAIGVTPAARAYDAISGAVAVTWLSEDWQQAYRDDLARGFRRESLIRLKKRLHDGPPFPRRRTIFSHLRELTALGDRLGTTWPDDHRMLVDYADRIAAAFAAAGHDMRPCHGDGHASNVMLGPGDGIVLVDFDLASENDPLYDLAATLLDIEAWDDGIAEAIEIYGGTFDRKTANRVKLHMILDDMMWARLAWIAAQESPRRHVEFLKYGEFRLLRCRYHLRVWPVDEMLRGL